MASQVTVRSLADTKFAQEVTVGPHRLMADEPAAVGGTDLGPSPYQYLLTALGTCTSMTLGLYAERKGIVLTAVEVRVRHDRIHAKDCEDCETEGGMLDEIHVEIHLEGDFDDAQHERMLQIAEMCPVHRTLTREVKIRTMEF